MSGSLKFESAFTADPIELEASKPGSLLKLYERGHAFGEFYARGSVPEDDLLRAALAEMLRLYRLVTARGGKPILPSRLLMVLLNGLGGFLEQTGYRFSLPI